MPNPRQPQGNLNRLIASINVNNFPALNITASFLGKSGISVAREGVTTTYLPQMVGAVTSPEPYQMVTVRVGLLKSQSLASAYDAQRLLASNIGDIVVRPDVSFGIGPIDLTNCSIENVGELTFSGQDAGYPITLVGYENINSALWP